MATTDLLTRLRCLFAAGCGVGASLAASVSPARAQSETSLIPATSALDVRVGDLRSLVGGLLTSNPDTPRAFTITPSIGLQELLTDNVLQRSQARGDLATFLTPAVTITGNSSRIQANLTYAPSFQVYVATSRQNQVAQNFNGQALITAVPDLLFLSMRGYASQQATTGNGGQSSSPILSQGNRTQTVGFSASPYIAHRLGSNGDIKVGYVLDYTQQTGSTAYGNNTIQSLTNQNGINTNAFNQTFAGNSSTVTNQEYVTYTTGENLGRFNDSISLNASQVQGTGVLNNSRRATAINSLGYGLTRSVALLGSFGYEKISYSGVPPVRISDAVYSAGFRLTPNQNSTVTITYGHKDGFNAVNASGSYLVTQRLRVFGNYSEGLTSSQQEIQDNLNSSTVDQYGNSVDGVTGAPVLISDSVLGLQNNLYRLKRLSASAVLTYDRDLFTLNLINEERRVLSVATGQSANAINSSDRGILSSVSWSHELRPDLSVTSSLQYGNTTTLTTPNSIQSNVAVHVSTAYAISETLTATAQYYVNSLSSNTRGQSYVQNVALVGLRKSF